MTYTNIFSRVKQVLVFLILLILSLNPVLSFAANSDSVFFSQRQSCTASYYNKGQYPQAADCYRISWQNSCVENQDACNRAANNIVIAMTRYKDDVCNPKFFTGDYSGAGGCYDVGINQTCNQNPTDGNLCNIYNGNKALVVQKLNSNNIFNNPNGSIYNSNYYSKLSQLQNYKSSCNQNWPNNISAFIDCSQQGANAACAYSGSEFNDLCSRFNNNVSLGYSRQNECYYNNYSYCSNNGTVNTIAAVLTGGVVLCAIAGCFNGNSGNSGGSADYGNNYYYGGGSSAQGPGGGYGSGQ